MIVKLSKGSFAALAENVKCLMLLNIVKSSGHGPNVAGSALVWSPPPPALRDTVCNANPSFCIMIPNVEIMLSSGGWTAGHMGEQADCLNIDYH